MDDKKLVCDLLICSQAAVSGAFAALAINLGKGVMNGFATGSLSPFMLAGGLWLTGLFALSSLGSARMALDFVNIR